VRSTPPETARLEGVRESREVVTGTGEVHLIREVAIRYVGARRRAPSKITEPRQVAEYLRRRVREDAREHFVAIYLDGRHRPIADYVVSVGTATASLVHPREVFQPAIAVGACALLIAHYVARHIMRLMCPTSICDFPTATGGFGCSLGRAAILSVTYREGIEARSPCRADAAKGGCPMLEHYFDRPQTLDRIRASWLADPIKRYVAWSAAQGYARETVKNRVPVLVRFGEYAARRGARRWEDLPALVVPFRKAWVRKVRPYLRSRRAHRDHFHAREIQRAIEHMIQRVLPDYLGASPPRRLPLPFADQAPGFVAYLRSERGLRETSVQHYLHYLRRFERYLRKARVGDLGRLAPATLREFMQEGSRGLSGSSIASLCDSLRVFLRYLHREQVLDRDLSSAIERPRTYRMARIPRSIPWEATQRLLQQVDRRTGAGRRDYAILLLLITYGLRARELAALTLDDLQWRAKTLRIPERKGGHSAQYRLTPAVGEAIVDYLERGRPPTKERRLFLRSMAPIAPLAGYAVSQRVTARLKRAGITVPRAGSHTLRHSVVQHLLEHEFSLQEIGRYVGHRSPRSTEVYTKVDLRHLREVALGDGEEVL